MKTDIVDLTDEFNEIIAQYEGGFSNDGWVVDFDAWNVEDLCKCADILDRAIDIQLGTVTGLLLTDDDSDEETLDEYLISPK